MPGVHICDQKLSLEADEKLRNQLMKSVPRDPSNQEI